MHRSTRCTEPQGVPSGGQAGSCGLVYWLSAGHALTKAFAGLVELGAWPHRVTRRNSESEPIALVAREDVQMHVEDLLPGELTVCQEEVDSVTSKISRTQRSRGALCDAKHLRTVLDIEVGEKCRMTTRHDEHMPAHDGLDVHEGHRSLVLVDDADLGLAGSQPTEQAFGHRYSFRYCSARRQSLSSEPAKCSGSTRCGGSKWWRSGNVSTVKSGNIAASRSAIRGK